ncbi:hypothetical protein [Pseudomonas sp. HY7a-MNA-CIBAN-0227]|uniref:hypothetical protein n=1 Tax=Pseudomonas sp. HY7a-MNA-CIBAN-0227 TaxID=3140474 RepID=UPI0033260814
MREEKIHLKSMGEELTFAITDKELTRIEKRITDLQANLKKHEHLMEKRAADVGILRHGLKPNEAKASEVEAQLVKAGSHRSLIVNDIAALTAFKEAFKKRLLTISKEIEEEKVKKATEVDRAKFKAEIIANPDLLIDLILDEKTKDKNINYVKFVAKLKKKLKEEGNEKAD